MSKRFVVTLLTSVLLAVGWSNGAAVAETRWSSRGIPLQGQVMLGAAIHGGVEPFEVQEDGRVGLHRTYFSASQVSSAVSRVRADQAAGRIPWISFKTPSSWAEMASGGGDAWAKDLAARLGATGKPVWVAIHHEPEGDGPLGDWVAMQRRLAPIFRAYDNIAYSIVLTGWNQFYSGNAAYSLDALWPGRQYVDILGFDPYNLYGTTDSSGRKTWGWRELRAYYAKINAWRAGSGNDVPWAIAETGWSDVAATVPQNYVAPNGKVVSTRGPGREWLARAYNDMKAAGGIALTYFSVPPEIYGGNPDHSWPLNSDKIIEFVDTLHCSESVGDPPSAAWLSQLMAPIWAVPVPSWWRESTGNMRAMHDACATDVAGVKRPR